MSERMIQTESELCALLDIVRDMRSYCEIGCFHGVMFDRVMRAMPKGSKGVAVDDVRAPNADIYRRSRGVLSDQRRHVSQLNRDGWDASLIIANSQSEKTRRMVARYAPFDLVFIDADHRLEGVTRDWENYKDMGSIIAFHDINVPLSDWMGVGTLWAEIKTQYRTQEIIESADSFGIGLVFMNDPL